MKMSCGSNLESTVARHASFKLRESDNNLLETYEAIRVSKEQTTHESLLSIWYAKFVKSWGKGVEKLVCRPILAVRY